MRGKKQTNMKSIQKLFLAWLLVLLAGWNFNLLAQTNRLRRVSVDHGIVAQFTNNPYALFIITNLLQEPPPELAVPTVSRTNHSSYGTYWMLQGVPVPFPFNPYPELPVYQVSTNRQFIIDTRSVDFETLAELEALEAMTSGVSNQTFSACATCALDLNGLWIEVPTNSLATPDYFTVAVHNTIQGQSYDILTTPSLPTSWATELVVTGAVGNVTSTTLPMNHRMNLFVRARTSVAYSFYLISPPLSQYVCEFDTVTFRVETGGNPNLTYQWTFNGQPIAGATNDSYTISSVRSGGDYAVIISDGTNSIITAAAQLTVGFATGDPALVWVSGARQDYTFRSGVTYYIGEPVELHGQTTIEGGAVLKFDYDYSTNSTLVVLGGLTCKTQPYNPAILTSLDDDSAGTYIFFSSGLPQPAFSGKPYVEMTCATSNTISDLRFCFADWGVTTPALSRKLDVWDCQFVDCHYGIVNLVTGSSTNWLHNVLFSLCDASVATATNVITVQGEQVTADVAHFCRASAVPNLIALTNSIVWGDTISASTVSSLHVVMNPNNTNFTSAGDGSFYLAANSPLHQSGSPGISPRLKAELRHKTTFAPVDKLSGMEIAGQLSLSPQVLRYTNGVPDVGYYYDALDYTISMLYVFGGTVTVLPGTAIGIRNGYDASAGIYLTEGILVGDGGAVVSHGLPDEPNIFTAANSVQETPNLLFAEVQVGAYLGNGVWIPGITMFVSGCETNDPVAPTLDFRFSNFYLPALDQHFCAGLSPDLLIYSSSSTVYLTLQDCSVHGGQINLNRPDGYDFPLDATFGKGAVTWKNSLFENVGFNLDPTVYWINQTVNCDMQLQACNNLFKNNPWMFLGPFPASAGHWVFKDNLFDKVHFVQDTNQPLDFDYNGYWPLTDAELLWSGDAGWLLPSVGGNLSGAHEPVLEAALPYRGGPFGNCYLDTVTPLWQAGSRTAADAGLAQYTTFVNQLKDASNQPVNIGLHYVAAANSQLSTYNPQLPLDSDGDGVPDYVEAEYGTDPGLAMTDGTTPDPLNPAYDDVDLDGDGLTGRAERFLATNPLIQDNPLKLTPVITGQEPYILTYSMPLNVDVSSNHCQLVVLDNGVNAGGYDFSPQINGTYLVEWNTTFAANGFHTLQVELSMPGYRLPRNASGTQAVLAVFGLIRLENVQNIVQLDPDETSFGSQAAFSGALAVQSADYQIQIFDTNSVLLTTITNHTDTGQMSETWDLTDSNGTTRSDEEFRAALTVMPSAQSGGLYQTNAIPIWRFKSGVCGDLFSLAFANASDGHSLHQDRSDMMRWAVEDTLFNPALNNEYTSSPLNGQGWENTSPFDMYCTTNPSILSPQQESLLTDLESGSVGNFYFNGHGSDRTIGDGEGFGLDTATTRIRLGNLPPNMKGVKGRKYAHPFRLVILDACECANAPLWPRAFGIPDATHYAEWFQRQGKQSQAFLGWKDQILDASNPTQVQSEGQHLANFFGAWMSGLPLVECVNIGATPDALYWRDDRPLDPDWKIFGDPFLTRTP